MAEHEFSSDLGWKIFLDRYTVKDGVRNFAVGDLAVVTTVPDPKWSKKEIGIVRELLADDFLEIELLTGDQAGEFGAYSRRDCDRPLETTLAEVANRIAKGVAAAEDPRDQERIAKEFAEEIQALRFVPGGRIWAAAGTDQQLTYFNCHVIPNPHDSRKGIIETLGEMIEIMSRGGGVGINISSLRPSRAYVKGVNGRSSGAVSWMDLYSRATGLVEQGGSRRGALMLQMEDWHPDIWRFINVKKTPGMVENANISVRISDGFMSAVKADGEWDLVFPDTTDPDYDTLWDGNLEKWKAAGKSVVVYETVKAKAIWDAIIQGAWQAAEPGLVFSERGEKESNSWYFNPLISTNPCVTGETRVATTEGLVPIKELTKHNATHTLIMDSRKSEIAQHPIAPAFATGIKPVVKITTREGYTLRCTPDHQIMTERGWIPARELQTTDKIHILNRAGAFGTQGSYDLGKTLGWLVGDGTITPSVAVLSFYDAKQELAEDMAESVNNIIRPSFNNRVYTVQPAAGGENETRVSSSRFREIAEQCGLIPNKFKVPEVVFRGTQTCQQGFLQALFSADGTILHNPKTSRSIRLTSISESLLEEVQQLLLNFNIFSRIYRDRHAGRTTSLLPDGHGGKRLYNVKPLYELSISRISVAIFAETIGFLLPEKQDLLERTLQSYCNGPKADMFLARVASVVPDGVEAVYDLTEPVTHSFSGNGLIIHNCAEEPLPAWGVCTLGHINVSAFYDEPTNDVNWEALGTTVARGVRFLDNIVDVTPYFSRENEENQHKERRIGMGTLGLGELLIKMGLRYGSPKSLEFIDKLYQFIAVEAYMYDTALSRMKGSFPAFDAEKLLQSGFMQRMPAVVRGAVQRNGLRNVTILTQAPTGSVGSMLGTSTGIEPYYALSYTRQSRLGLDQQFVPIAADWKLNHPGEALPSYFVGAMDLTPEEHIYVQAAIQRWTDASLSKTANAPSTFTVEDTARLYELAYDLGCKGTTIYRDQSRSEQVLRTDTLPAEIVTNVPPLDLPAVPAVRSVPPVIHGTTYRKETPAGTARVIINEAAEDPLEVFMLLGRAGSEIQSFMEGLGRMISLYLRSGDHLSPRERLRLVADQLQGIGGANQMGFGGGRVLSVVDGIGQLLQEHLNGVPGGEIPSPLFPLPPTEKLAIGVVMENISRDLCPTCGAAAIVREEGCLHCVACGYSRC